MSWEKEEIEFGKRWIQTLIDCIILHPCALLSNLHHCRRCLTLSNEHEHDTRLFIHIISFDFFLEIVLLFLETQLYFFYLISLILYYNDFNLISI